MNESQELSFSELRRKRGKSAPPLDETDSIGNDAGDSTNFQREEPHFDPGEWKQQQAPWEEESAPRRRALPSSHPIPETAPPPTKVPFDPIRLLDVLKEKWKLWLGAALVLGTIGFLYGYSRMTASVSAQIMRREVPNLFNTAGSGDLTKPQQFSEQTLFTMIKAPEVLRRVSQKAAPPITPGKLSYILIPQSEQGSELVTLTLRAKMKPQEMVDLLNLYSQELVQYSKDVQSQDARDLQAFLGKQLDAVNLDLERVNTEMNKFSPEEKFVNPDKQTEAFLVQLNDLDLKYETAKINLETIDFNIDALRKELVLRNPLADKLRAAQDRLAAVLVKYTDQHPDVLAQKAEIASLEKQLAAFTADANAKITGSTAADTLYLNIVQLQTQKKGRARELENYQSLKEKIQGKLTGLSEKSLHYAMVKSHYQNLENMAASLSAKKREAQSFEQNSLGYFKVFTPASSDRVARQSPWLKSSIFALAAAFLAFLAVGGFVVVKEILDDRLRTAADVERVTSLPVLGTLGDLDKMSPTEQTQWAFRTWTIIKGKLSASQNEGLVCGFISAHHGEGRSTWIRLLTKTANMRGLRVLTVATRPTQDEAVHPHEAAGTDAPPMPAAPSTTEFVSSDPKSDGQETNEGFMQTTLSPSVLASPGQVTQQLTEPNSLPMVHIPLPGWVWNLERRTQWQQAMEAWGKIDNLVLLAELPPASEPESVLLAEKLPQLIWLADSGKATAKETRMHLETLRHANCRLVGAVLNHEPVSFFRNQISRWFGAIALLAALNFTAANAAEADTAQPAPGAHNLAFSVTASTPRAPWQQHLTLGPGDVLNLGFFGETNLNKADVVIGPDGRISYLQARDIMAAGLTIDELRKQLDDGLAKFYRSPRTLVTPVAYRSKKYIVMGKVVKKGVYSLDRPITVVEALARAQGLETGVLDRNTIDMADLQRSFLVRQGKRIPINFEKLFHEGDLSQNLQIEPDDYLYFPSTALKEIYVVGAVRTPGVVTYTDDASVAASIAQRGGFGDRAWKSRVLVVRGSLNHPESFVVDMLAIQDARSPDFKLQPKDIIYVANRPFIKAEELLDVVATAFVQSAVTAWTGFNVGPLIRSPIIPSIEPQ